MANNWIKKSVKAVSEKGGIFTFIRAQFSSQIASITDFFITIVLSQLFNIYYVYATFTGSLCGGIINCIVNYQWTFKAQGIKKRYILIKYVMVWIFSIWLNTSGTYFMTELLRKITWLTNTLGDNFDDIFIISKIIVSLLVGWIWNYNMQRLFVYKDVDLKKYFKRNKSDSSEIKDN